ncbi:uncharacterized protein FIBRA_06708 [Fibroporia radiculosa]|uniref:Calcipressin n=1 Tax=Fibroporia radiculosa TaxID=599839 RepID=J4HZJ0_9APHY|nr:uncharacterized protein FIBRA_06708 [Fibroporia radiculosa]CCM04527.1 predicted protein [Fibroporia radiculosa]
MDSPSASIPSSPSLTSNSGPSTPHRTNTLVITQLPASFFEQVVLDTLHNHFASYGPVYAWAPLKSFARILLVYYSEDDAEHAKVDCDFLFIGATPSSPATTLRVYRADPTPIVSSGNSAKDNMYLRPPEHEKNFLISPPGSPPVGWEQIREDPPNSTPLAADLITALRRLQLQEEQRSGPGLAVLLEPQDGVGIGVYVEDCDGDGATQAEEEQDWVYGEMSPARARWRPVPTALPPMSIGA